MAISDRHPFSRDLYRRGGKRLLDLVITVPLLVFVAPIIAVIAILVRLKLGSPVWFRQTRPGRDERPFTLIKFRTMTDARDSAGKLLPDAARLTPFGKWLRRTSLDELPELWNILRGDMSLVGPRPLLMQYLPRYSAFQRRRHALRPGLTGWAQINGRNALSWEQKFELDVWYVDHCSFALDLQILLRTVGIVFKREGITGTNHDTMQEFLGTTPAPDVHGSKGEPL